jgi:FtsH-binding integral membrane protein
MSVADSPYRSPQATIAAYAAANERSDFITKTYLHLAGAIALFVALEAILLQMPFVQDLVGLMIGTRLTWLVILGLFVVVSTVANNWAMSTTSTTTQYLGLGLYVVAEAILFVPLLFVARMMEQNLGQSFILPAGVATLVLFGVMTGIVFVTRADFSFMRSALFFGGIVAFGLIAASLIFGFVLGQIFCIAMIALACGYILYDTSNVMHHYRIGQHVAASLALFASVALLFWYVLRLLMSLRR